MNLRGLFLFLAIFLISLAYAQFTLNCVVRNSNTCPAGEVKILGMSATTNAHAEIPSLNNYPYSVCCTATGGSLGNSCSGTYVVFLRLSSNTNAHVQEATYSDYPNAVCLSSNVQLSCSYAKTCSPGTWALNISISSDTNAHVGDDSAYSSRRICCGSGCLRNNPTVTILPSSQTGSAGQTLTYTVNVTNHDSLACGSSTFNLSSRCPAGGWSCSLALNSLVVAPGSSNSTTISVTSPITASPRTYTFNVTANNSNNSTFSGTGSANYTVSICNVFLHSSDLKPNGYVINQNNTVYCLSEDVTFDASQDLSKPVIVFNASVKNSTLNCQSHTLNGNNIANIIGIEIDGNNNTVIDCRVVNFDTSIWINGMNNTIRSSLITAFDECIRIDGTNNTLLDNVIRDCGIGLNIFGSNNSVRGGSVERDPTTPGGREYELHSSGHSSGNRFNMTNFTVVRVIVLVGSAEFNYSDDGSIWLSTIGGSAFFNRALLNWSTTNLSWEDWKNTAFDPNDGLFVYNITGLLPNTDYFIYNNSQFYQSVTSSPTGSLGFSIIIPGDGSHQLIEVTTTTPPCTYSLSISPTSSIRYDSSYNFSINATDSSSSSCPSPITYNIAYATVGDCSSVSVTQNFQIARGGSLSPAFWVNITRGSSACTVNVNVTDPNGNVVATGSYTVSPLSISDVVITSVYPPRKIVETGETFSLTLTLHNYGSDIGTLSITNVRDSKGVINVIPNSWTPASISPFQRDAEAQVSITANSSGRFLTSTIIPVIDAVKDGTPVEIRPAYPIMNLSISKREVQIGSTEKINISISPWDMLTDSPLSFNDLRNVRISFYKFEEKYNVLNLIYQRNLDSATFQFTLESIGIKGITNPGACGYYVVVVTGEKASLPGIVGSDSVGFIVTGCLYAG